MYYKIRNILVRIFQTNDKYINQGHVQEQVRHLLYRRFSFAKDMAKGSNDARDILYKNNQAFSIVFIV